VAPSTPVLQQVQALQQAAATQRQLQQAKSMISAQQQHVQKIQQSVARHRQMQKHIGRQSPSAGSTTTATTAPPAQTPFSPGRRHQAVIQRALAQVGANRVPSGRHASVRKRAQKVSSAIARIRGHKGPSAASASLPRSGRHHSALIRNALQHTGRGKLFGHPGGHQKVAQHVVFQHMLTRLRGHSRHGHQIRQHAIFKHIFAKLRHRNKPAPTPAPAPVPTPAPKTTNTAVKSGLPNLPGNMPSTSLVEAVKSVVKSSSSNDDASTASLAGSTISKLGGPRDPKQANESGKGSSAKKRDEDDDLDGEATKGGSKSSGGLIDLRPLATLPAIGSYNPRQVLAVGLSDIALKRILNRRFRQIADFRFPLALGSSKVTQLETPEGENAVASIAKLKELEPEAGFTLNRLYAPYRLGASGSGVARDLGRGSIGCAANRCFGSSLIKWQPQVAACARDVKIGIIDTGYDRTHPAFATTRHTEKTFAPKNSAVASKDHGTGILALLGGSLESSTPGLVPHADYYVANAFYAEANGGQPVSDTTDLLAALEWLKRSEVAIINLSFAGPKDDLVHFAVKKLARSGVVLVAAAGNDGPHATPRYPAAYPEVVAVTAVDRNLAPYRYANRGAYIDVAAPGVGIWTALPGKREGVQTGTSFAVPYVTAVLAMNHARLEGLASNQYAPKRRALEILRENVMKLGGAARGNETFGAGLVQAPESCPQAPGVAVAKQVPGAAPSLQPWVSSVVPSVGSVRELPQALGWTTNTYHAATVKARRR
jgi:hypothetical protein